MKINIYLFTAILFILPQNSFGICLLTLDGITPKISRQVDPARDCRPPGLHIDFQGRGISPQDRARTLVVACKFSSDPQQRLLEVDIQVYGKTSDRHFGSVFSQVNDPNNFRTDLITSDYIGVDLLCAKE